MAIALLCLGCLLAPQSADQILRLGDDRVEVTARGALGPRGLPRGRPAGDAKPRVWRARVRIAADLRVGARRTTMDAAAVAKVRDAFATFGRMVNAWSRGRVRIDADIAVMEEPLHVPDRDEPFWLTPMRQRDCGISGEGVDSVFLVFPPGQRELAMLGGTFGGNLGPDGAGSTGIAWVPSREDEMVRTILHEWLHQVEWLARHKFDMPWLPGSHDRRDLGFVDEDRALAALIGQYLSTAFWRAAGIRESQSVRRLAPGRNVHWRDVADDPWRRLPFVDGSTLAKLTGYPVRIEVGRGFVEAHCEGQAPEDVALDRRIDLEQESALILPVRGTRNRYVCIVRGDRAELFGRHLRRADGERIVAGVLLPLRPKQRIGNWEAGGTATPLAVFVTTMARRPRTEVELLSIRDGQESVALERTTGVAVVGAPVGFRRIGPADDVSVADRQIESGASVQTTPTVAGSLSVVLRRGEDRLPYRTPVLPQVTVELKPRSGPDSVVRADAAFVCVVRNNTTAKVKVALEVWVSPEVAILDLPKSLVLVAGAERVLPCRIRVEADRPAGQVEVRLVARGGGEILGQVRKRLHVAVGRDFLRLDFEGRVYAMRPAKGSDTDAGDWSVRRRTGLIGRGCLRIADGGGSRFGRHHVMPPSPLSFDSEQFPHLTFYFRARPKKGARVAINLAVGSDAFSIPLVGEFVREWDKRRPLPRARVKLTGEWCRVTYDLDAALDKALGDGNHRVLSIDFGDTRARCSNRFSGDDEWYFEVDEFAVVRTPGETADDHVRYLTQKYRRMLSTDAATALRKGLAAIDTKKLGPQGRVDHELLCHALEWQRVSSKLPRKRRGRPAGRERYAAMLRHRHHLTETPEDLLKIGKEQVGLHQGQMEELTAKIAPGKTWREVIEILKARHPTGEELPKVAEKWMKKAIDFTVEHELVTVPMAARDARIRVVTRGVLSRTYPFGGYGGTRRTARGFTGTYLVSPPAEWMSEAQAEERLRGNHYAWTRVVALHEVVPGHHLQTVVHTMRPLSAFRRQFYSTVFGEGWAMHCEELLFRHGFFPDVETRFTQLQMRLWRAARIVIDASLHTGKMSIGEAEKFLVDEVSLDPINAKAEVARYIDNPTRPMSYLMGFLIIEKLKERSRKLLGAQFSSRVFLDRVLSFGPVPLSAVAKGLGL